MRIDEIGSNSKIFRAKAINKDSLEFNNIGIGIIRQFKKNTFIFQLIMYPNILFIKQINPLFKEINQNHLQTIYDIVDSDLLESQNLNYSDFNLQLGFDNLQVKQAEADISFTQNYQQVQSQGINQLYLTIIWKLLANQYINFYLLGIQILLNEINFKLYLKFLFRYPTISKKDKIIFIKESTYKIEIKQQQITIFNHLLQKKIVTSSKQKNYLQIYFIY
ncbi:hypothetical protein pb186bvf_007308 [Paramecium bursaria]